MKTIIVEAIQNKLKHGRKENSIVYVTGSLGSGKTTAVKYFYRDIPNIYLDGSSGTLHEMPDAEEIGEKILIIDNISQITDISSRKYILERIGHRKEQIILIGRGKIPNWMAAVDIEQNFLIVGNKDLQFTDENIRDYYESRYATAPTDPDEFNEIVERSWRNALFLGYMIDNDSHEEDSIAHIITAAEHSMFQYMDHKFYNQLRREMREVLIQLSMIGPFNAELAEMVTADSNIRRVMEEMNQFGNFLSTKDHEIYYVRGFYVRYLNWKEGIILSRRQREIVYERAALYYEIHENMERALFFYKKAKDSDKILHLLTRVSEEDPEMMNFTEFGPYLEDISEERIKNEPVLMSGMSMIYSLRMNSRRSEEWYKKLKAFSQMQLPDSTEERDAQALLRFLDIKLPHRSTENLEQYLGELPEYEAYYEHGGYRKASFTIGMPSALNGSLDFSDFMLRYEKDGQSIVDLAGPIAHLLESDVHSTFRLVRAEWRFERDEMQGYEFDKVLNESYLAAVGAGDMPLAFAAMAIFTKTMMARGNMHDAMEHFDRFRLKTKDSKDKHMKACIEAYYVRMMIRQGDISYAGEWLSKAPDSTEFFTIRDRYLYIQKLRVLIMMQRYQVAHALIQRMEAALELYHRPYLGIQTKTLKAILFYREGNAIWQDILISTMKKAQQYGYIHILADEGAALKPLLDKLEKKKAYAAEIDPEYLERVIEATDLMTVYYPQYLREVKELEEPLTDMEHKVIRLMCHEMNTDEICDLLHISYSALKFHKQNIYRKFDVKNRNEAQRKAKSLGLNLS